ncbi:MAG: ATP-binding cassette domain-containing protein [Clostridiales Family XIII bacterium]|jgi:ABC-2 type transport system ATP-binding protein|nr:ATP-binding cassette domain-containing protein [Clostridiales Family XIII bacterium]
MSEYVLRTRAIGKKYGANFALDNVSVEVKRGWIYGLIGLNGAGKTTFMRAVAGLIAPTSGDVELFGESGEAALGRGRRRMGQSIETPAVYPHMSAKENLEVQRILGGVPDRDAAERVLKIVGLTDTGSKKVRNFSLGMKQRLALAIALITNPEFLMLDEPANGLDPKGIIETRELMRRLAKEQGLTLLVSSHLLDELEQVATHYGILHKGKIVKHLSAEELSREMRRYLRIVTPDAPKTVALLREAFGVTDVKAVSKNEIRVYEQLGRVSEINARLVAEGIAVEGIGVAEQKLEEYFVALTGGDR